MKNHTTRTAASHTRHALFETVAEEVFRRYGRAWKPRTAKVGERPVGTPGLCRHQPLHCLFEGLEEHRRPMADLTADIDRRDITVIASELIFTVLLPRPSGRVGANSWRLIRDEARCVAGAPATLAGGRR